MAASGHLRIVVCGAGPAADVLRLVETAQERSWTTTVVATASALDFIDVSAITQLTGSPVRGSYQTPDDGGLRTMPPVDALIIAPATYNTVNKLASGVADTYPLTSTAELIGRGVPTVVVPFVNTALATRAPFQRSIADLRAEGVRVISGPDDGWIPHPPGTGTDRRADFPWQSAFLTARKMRQRRSDS
ncbi:flavoprotein [Micromonospora sp. NBC_01813]|uniref:flavoprotein n=1 Tax=Micromonospora sp. NBC_01813 TaxID=2975988 RepID=UPI002DD8FA01|nr:flavoprotein [Micromonospora sp. NBC_01813]WSA12839.1 flavoprotein [Micromonospora sp. NBC_01813]